VISAAHDDRVLGADDRRSRPQEHEVQVTRSTLGPSLQEWSEYLGSDLPKQAEATSD
jgi:hypothetical protein